MSNEEELKWNLEKVPEWDGEPVCPTCGKELNTAHGVKNHHARVHGVSLTRVRVECNVCDAEFMVDRWNYENSESSLCSKECQSEWQSEKNLREGTAPPGQTVGKDLVTKECTNCGEEVTRHSSGFPGENAFCSRECTNEWQREYKGMNPVQAQGHSWRTYRRAILKRDNKTCQKCGYEGSLRASDGEKELHVHHIRPRRSFETKREANKPSNVITLCHNCHVAVEQCSASCPTPDDADGDVIDGYNYYEDSPWAKGSVSTHVKPGSRTQQILGELLESGKKYGVIGIIEELGLEIERNSVSALFRSLLDRDMVEREEAQHPSGHNWPYYVYCPTEKGKRVYVKSELSDSAVKAE